MTEPANNRQGARRLNSWKEIAAHFGKDERTVKRWEVSRGLPVRRVPGGARTTVFAYVDELDSWLAGGGERATRPAAPAEGVPAQQAMPEPPPPGAGKRGAPMAWLPMAAALIVAVLVAGVVGWQFWPARSATAYAAVPEARELYLEGAYLWEKRTAESLREAETLFRRATEIDPNYAQAFAGLANTYNLLREYSAMPAAKAYAAAVEAGRRAVALDPSDADAMSALAFAEFYGLRLLPEGLARFRQALAIEPNSSKTRLWLGNALLHLGHFDEALAEIETAQRLDPSSRAILSSKGLALLCTGSLAEAEAVLRDMVRLEPDYLSPHAYLALLYLARGDYAAFLDETEAVGRLREDPSRAVVVAAGRQGFARSGREGMLAAMLAEERRLVADGGSLHFNVARIAALSGDVQAAIDGLRASVEAGEEHILGINIDPAFRFVRSNAAFRDFVASYGLTVVP